MVAVAAGFGIVILLGTRFLARALRQHRASEERFQQMASNIREIFWMIDAETKRALYVNEAYETITGRSCQSLFDNQTSYEELIHPEDRSHVLAKLEEATQTGLFDERFRIVCPLGEERWVKVHGFPVRDHAGRIRRLVGTTQEITAQKQAEDQADALRQATLALTQDLRMDFVLGTLLRSLAELVPYTCARVLVPEGGPHVLALGERWCPEPADTSPARPLTLNADKSPFLKRLLADQKSVLISDTSQEKNGRRSRAMVSYAPGSLSRWSLPSGTWGCFRSATPIRTSIHRNISAVPNCWPFLPPRQFKMLASTKPLKSMAQNSKNE